MLHLANLPALSAQTYILFRFGHLPHHSYLGAESVSEAKNFLRDEAPDVELLIGRYYYELSHYPHENPRPLIPFVFNNKALRMIFAFLIFPFVGTFFGVVVVPAMIIFAYFKKFFVAESANYCKKVNAIFTQLILVYITAAILYLIAGPFAILYLFLSDVSSRGLFFHPGILFGLSTHKTWGSEGHCQPTTSTYSWFSSLILMNINYHIEHHDFPDIPRRYLPKLKKVAADFYDNLTAFQGLVDLYLNYYQAPHWIYAGIFQRIQSEQKDKGADEK